MNEKTAIVNEDPGERSAPLMSVVVPVFNGGEDFDRCLARCAPTKDDILIVSVGATTGRTAIVDDCEPFAGRTKRFASETVDDT